VFNLGTIEHCWDMHRAWSNALRAVAVGGSFLTHSPVGGWLGADGALNHGVHMTAPDAICRFLDQNGFVVLDKWLTRWRNRGALFWLRAEKLQHIAWLENFAAVYQVRGLSPDYRATR
jgi:hypothetical protein